MKIKSAFEFMFQLFKAASTEIDTLGDCSADVEELALTAEDGVTIPYMVGELFVMEEPDQVQTLLEERK